MNTLAPTPADRLVDGEGRPYFLWDDDMSLETFRAHLSSADPAERAYFLGKLMRQAKPDDVFAFVTLAQVEHELPAVDRYLGNSRDFWHWLVVRWKTVRGTR